MAILDLGRARRGGPPRKQRRFLSSFYTLGGVGLPWCTHNRRGCCGLAHDEAPVLYAKAS